MLPFIFKARNYYYSMKKDITNCTNSLHFGCKFITLLCKNITNCTKTCNKKCKKLSKNADSIEKSALHFSKCLLFYVLRRCIPFAFQFLLGTIVTHIGRKAGSKGCCLLSLTRVVGDTLFVMSHTQPINIAGERSEAALEGL